LLVSPSAHISWDPSFLSSTLCLSSVTSLPEAFPRRCGMRAPKPVAAPRKQAMINVKNRTGELCLLCQIGDISQQTTAIGVEAVDMKSGLEAVAEANLFMGKDTYIGYGPGQPCTHPHSPYATVQFFLLRHSSRPAEFTPGCRP
jgi:hypothetical protein